MYEMTKALKYYIALQPVIKKTMGEWQEGDEYLYKWNNSDQWMCSDISSNRIEHIKNLEVNGFVFLRIPPTIDDSGQKRGLIDMIKGFKSLTFHPALRQWWLAFYVTGRWSEVTADTPELALLKAIAAQEGITV